MPGESELVAKQRPSTTRRMHCVQGGDAGPPPVHVLPACTQHCLHPLPRSVRTRSSACRLAPGSRWPPTPRSDDGAESRAG
eukprot:860541-Prymnesium_polylepis.1